ncbi:MarR family transcriptional regulator [Kitasatospora sp. MMS16-BH015]|uniref:MarR family winged helix-turn-helix transcriptional regulator n=1 Tax=Kitasatospora sp. MMS16-BH015 TaxID=2018025 RepID=UPI000CA2DFB4|nr:MarR family transcriptional regulator [Kitasatospora sp. MMS16-BH015]AUG77172.1 MarR family transcriptional regulator [Kitasatospora sp. MMS16-BH015]
MSTPPADPSPAGPSPASGDPDAVDVITAQWQRVRPDLETAAMATFGRVYRLAKAVGDRTERAYAAYGIGRGEFDVLATLRRSGEPYTLSPRELTATLMLTTGGMTGRLDKLEKAELLTRSPDPTDRRALRVTLTPAGLDLIDQAVGAGLVAQQAVLDGLTPAEVETLNDLLRRLLTAAS